MNQSRSGQGLVQRALAIGTERIDFRSWRPQFPTNSHGASSPTAICRRRRNFAYPNSAKSRVDCPNPARMARNGAEAAERRALGRRIVEGSFDDIDAMAASPLAWDQKYEQIGRGRFQGRVTQLLVDQVQLARAFWSPGVLQRGSAAKGTWAFGLPLVSEGSLHVRRRPAASGRTHRGDITGRRRFRRDRTNGPHDRRAADFVDRSLGTNAARDRSVRPRSAFSALAGGCRRDGSACRQPCRSLLEALTTEPDDLPSDGRCCRRIESQNFRRHPRHDSVRRGD